jgi:predicted amidohydrolase YtcJ
VIASMQPVHALSDWHMADRYWGERSKFSYAWKSLTDQNARLIFGSDAPVESPNPWLGIHACVTRQPTDELDQHGWYPEQRLTLQQALQGYTSNPAFSAGRENVSGLLRAGFMADLVILDDDIFSQPPEQLRTVRTFATMVAGQWAWKADHYDTK